MSNVNDARIKITLLDDFSGKMGNVNNQFSKFTNNLSKGANEQNLFSKSTGAASKALSEQQKGLGNIDALLNRVTYSAARYLAVYKGFQAVGDLWDSTVVAGFKYNKMLETNRVGMAGILSSMMKLDGKQLEWNQAMNISSNIMKKLSDEALKTSATTEDLVETFRGLLGPGLGAGMKISEIVNLTTVGVNAVRSLGLPTNQYLQELRGMIQGGLKPSSSTLATALGISDKDIKEAKKSSEGLYNFLMARLKGFALATEETSNTFEGRVARLQEGVQRTFGQAEKNLLYPYLSQQIDELANKFTKIETITTETGNQVRVVKLNEDFEKSVEDVLEKFIMMGEQVKEIGTDLAPVGSALGSMAGSGLDFVAKHLKEIVGLFVAYKALNIATDVARVAQNFDRQYVAQTKVGTVTQRLVNFFSGYEATLKAVAKYQNDLTNALNGFGTVTRPETIDAYAERWQQFGMSAKEAAHWIAEAYKMAQMGSATGASEFLKLGESKAQQTAYNKAYTALQAKSANAIEGAFGDVRGELSSQRSYYNSLVNSARTEESVTRLKEKLMSLGMSAEEAGAMQDKAVQLVLAGSEKEARAYMQSATAAAEAGKRKSDALSSVKSQLTDNLKLLEQEEEHQSRLQKLMEKVNKAALDAMGKRKKNGTETNYGPIVQQNAEKLQSFGLSNAEVYRITKQQYQGLKNRDYSSIESVSKLIAEYEKATAVIEKTDFKQQALTNSVKEYASTDFSKLTAEQIKLIEFDARTMEGLTKNKEAVEQVRIARENLTAAVQQGTLTQQQGQQLTVELNRQEMTGYVDIAGKIAEKINLAYKESTLNSQNAEQIVSNLNREVEERNKVVLATTEEGRAIQRVTAEANALTQMSQKGTTSQLEGVRRVTEEFERQIAVMKQKGLNTEEVEAREIEFLNKVAQSEGVVTDQIIKATEAANLQNASLQKGHPVLQTSIDKFGRLSMGLGIALQGFADLTGAQDTWIQKAADSILQVSFFVTALNDLVKMLKETAMWSKIAQAGLLSLPTLAVGAGAAVAGNFLATEYDKLSLTDKQGAMSGFNNLYSPTEAAMLGLDEQPTTGYTGGEQQQKGLSDLMDDLFKEVDQVREQFKEKEPSAMPDESRMTPAWAKDAQDNAKDDKATKKAEAAARKAEEAQRKLQEQIEQADMKQREIIVSSAEQMAEAGKQFGVNGCTAFVDATLNNTDLADYFDGEGRDVGKAFAKALADGRGHYGTEGMKAGDVIVYASEQWQDGAHVGVYDGAGGVFHNSTSAGYRAYHAPNYNQMGDEWVLGYISTGVNGAQGMDKQKLKLLTQKAKAQQESAKLTSDLIEKIGSLSDVPDYQKQAAKYRKEMSNISLKISGLSTKGIDTTDLTELRDKYQEEINRTLKEAEEDWIGKTYQDEMQRISDKLTMNLIDKEGYNEELSECLASYEDYLRACLDDTELSYEQRKQLESDLTSVIEKENEIRKETFEGGLQLELENLRQYSIDYQSIFGEITGAFSTGLDGLMDGVITGQKSFSENIKNSWQDICNSVVNAIWKMAMQAYIVRPLFNWLGGMFGSPSVLSVGSGFGGFEGIGSLSGFSSIAGIGTYASGGVANGWSLVGEKGPELVNFANPARVYTAQQTAQAMQGGGLNNVKVEIVNETNEDVKADNANVKFDGENYIIQVVMKAVSINKMGIRNMLKGAASV